MDEKQTEMGKGGRKSDKRCEVRERDNETENVIENNCIYILI
jgi:hypothetical protein